ncbi:hypothetical protein ILUMI_18567, partial [Ignelater luminosus]
MISNRLVHVCSFTKAKKNESDKWYGSVMLLSERDLAGIWLRLIFDRSSLQLGNWFGEVETTDNKEYLIKDRNFPLKANVSQTIELYIQYDPNEPIPKLVSFKLNDKTICPEGLLTESLPAKIIDARGAENVTAPSSPVGNAGGGIGEGLLSEGNLPWLQEPSSSDEFYPGDLNVFNRPNQQSPVDNTDITSICGTVV